MYFTQALIDHYRITPSTRRGAAGYSNGGMLAYSIGCTRGDLVAGVGVMSGAMLDDADTCTDSFPIPVIIFHGVGDFVLPYNGNEWYGPVSETVDLWLNQNQIPASSLNSTTLNGGDVQLDQYSGGLQGTCLSFYTINQEYGAPGGHVWFTQEIDGVAPGQLLWDFFNDGCDGAFTTGLNETDAEPIGFYPNPIADQLHATGAGAHDLFVQLVNLHGQTVLSGQRLERPPRISGFVPRTYLLQYGNGPNCWAGDPFLTFYTLRKQHACAAFFVWADEHVQQQKTPSLGPGLCAAMQPFVRKAWVLPAQRDFSHELVGLLCFEVNALLGQHPGLTLALVLFDDQYPLV